METRVAVVGGAGSFGRNLVQGLLSTTDCHVVVCGRSLAKAQAFVDGLAARSERVSAAAIDRDAVSVLDIAALRAMCVVDAAGPFQGQDLTFARAVIEAGCHYVDLADARDFVAAFGALDDVAKAHNVVAITGASSTPALSHAVIDDITRGWTRVDSVEIAISPGNRAPLGLSVIRAILSYVGRPLRVWRHGRWTTAAGWGLLTRRSFGDLGPRFLSLCETPDLDLVPQRFPQVRTTIFRAGLELWFLHLGLWLLSLPVRARWMKSLVPLAEPLRDAASLFHSFGSDCGGMLVDVTGVYGDGAHLQTTWRLIVEAGDGPQIPAVPALCVVRALVDGSLSSRGATVCVGLVDLAAMERQFKRFAIHTSRETRTLERVALFRRVLSDFDLMPAPLCAAHSPDPACDLAGEVDIDGAETWAGRLIARLFGFPSVGQDLPASVTIEREGDGETWIRRFGGAAFSSELQASEHANRLTERFGPFAFTLEAQANAEGFSLSILDARLMGFRLPQSLAPNIKAGASLDEQGRYHFDVLVALPMVGRLVRYRGWLAPVISAPSP